LIRALQPNSNNPTRRHVQVLSRKMSKLMESIPSPIFFHWLPQILRHIPHYFALILGRGLYYIFVWFCQDNVWRLWETFPNLSHYAYIFINRTVPSIYQMEHNPHGLSAHQILKASYVLSLLSEGNIVIALKRRKRDYMAVPSQAYRVSRTHSSFHFCTVCSPWLFKECKNQSSTAAFERINISSAGSISGALLSLDW